MCFNAAKSWQLGWYDDKSSEVKPEDGAFTGDLSAFVDYKNVPTGGNVLIKVGTKYLIFNKAKGINAETQEFANTITITDMPRDGDFSDAVGSLGSNGATYRFGHSGSTAIIELCSIQNTGGVDSAKISIYMEGTGATCGPGSGGPPPPPPPQPPTPPAPTPPAPTPPAPTPPAPTPPAPTPTITFPPQAARTRAPQASPTGRGRPRVYPRPRSEQINQRPTNTCTEDQMQVDITIQTDSKPAETSFYFKRRRGKTYGTESFTEPFHQYIYKYCVEATGTYEFHLEDSGDDGIQSTEHGHGFYTIMVDGEIYNSGGSFTSEEVDYVQGTCTVADQARIQFMLSTGNKPEDVSWTLTSVPAELVNHAGGPWPKYVGRSLDYFANACLPLSGCYTITVLSADGSGLDRGSLAVNWDDNNVAFSQFTKGSSEAFSFGDCESSNGRKLDLTEIRAEVFVDIDL